MPRRLALIVALGSASICLPTILGQSCLPATGPETDAFSYCVIDHSEPQLSVLNDFKVGSWSVTWPDGSSSTQKNTGNGRCIGNESCYYYDVTACWAYFDQPVSDSGSWSQMVEDASGGFFSTTHACPNNSMYSGNNTYCQGNGTYRLAVQRHTCCTGSAGFVCSTGGPVCSDTGTWTCPAGATLRYLPPSEIDGCQSVQCVGSGWTCVKTSPIVVDVKGEGFHLTGAQSDVEFAFFPGKPPVRISWTDAAYSNGFLALDRNGNGTIDDGTELFGNLTPQPPSKMRNGYSALAVFDQPAAGGNGNGMIDPGDAVYQRLRIWIDANHNGISEPEELHTLAETGIHAIGLKYELDDYVDLNGNEFRYRAKIWDAAGREHNTCYDVILTTRP